MLFRWEKHGAPVRRDFRGRYKYKSRGGVLLRHGRSFRAQFALKGAHASPSLLAYAAGRGWGPAKTPRAASCLLMGSRPQWPPFGAKPRNCKYSYGVSPGFPPGSFYPPPPRSAAAKGRMIRCSSIYIILISYSCTPVNILFRKRGPPPAASAGGGWVRVWARTR